MPPTSGKSFPISVKFFLIRRANMPFLYFESPLAVEIRAGETAAAANAGCPSIRKSIIEGKPSKDPGANLIRSKQTG
jgi:hypothetical protein